MQVVPTSLAGMAVLEPVVHADARGFFAETFRADVLVEAGIDETWVQDNHSRSARGVLRGMHFAVGQGQAKLVRCVRGAVLDVGVDIRAGSPTFGRWHATVLDDVDLRMVYLPVGFAHGFLVLSALADVAYRCSTYYDPVVERGFAWNDPAVGIDWTVAAPTLSTRDSEAPLLADVACDLPFVYEG
jgi:dTDP-4-dehydrorhamnose 3,5-epimerase